MALDDYADELARCNRCGFCQSDCPVFRAAGHEAGVARGRIALLRGLLEGRVEWSREVEEPLFECLGCAACTANCFPAIPMAEIVRAAREDYLERVGRGPLHRLLFNHLLPYPGRLRFAARAAALGKKTGLSKAAKALGLLRFLGRDFPKAEGIVEQFPSAALRDLIPPRELDGRGDSLRIGYFAGCGMDIMCPDAAQASLRLLRHIGSAVSVLNNGCCGLPAAAYGDREAARRLARRNLDVFDAGPFDLIVTDCSSCASFLKNDYPKLFPPGDPDHDRAARTAARVRDLVEVLAEHPETAVAPGEPMTVTYHDPCHACRGQGLTREPRAILESLAGVEYRELPEANWCCGAAGSYALSHYERSMQVLDRKMDNVAKTGAQVLATSCPACLIQLSYGARRRGLPVEVRHISEIVAGAERRGESRGRAAR